MSHGLHARSGGVDYFSLVLGDSKVLRIKVAAVGGFILHMPR